MLEYGSPHELIEKVNGAFASMVNDTGSAMKRELTSRAKMSSVKGE